MTVALAMAVATKRVVVSVAAETMKVAVSEVVAKVRGDGILFIF